MKGANGTIVMSGEKMSVLVDAGFLASCQPGAAMRLPSIMARPRKTLMMRVVARYFIQGIRIGETISLVDKKCGYAFRLKVEAHSICVIGVYDSRPPTKDVAQALYLVNENLIRAVKGRLVAA